MINKIILILHFIQFSFSKKNIQMLFDKNKILLIDTPIHGNLGDQAISIAEKRLLKKMHTDSNIYEISNTELKYCLFNIWIATKKSDCIYIQGGGFIGSLWKEEHNMFIKCLKVLKEKRIVIFPQTVYFYDNEIELKEGFFSALDKCKNLTFCVRDVLSYNLLKDENARCEVIYTPDIVLSLDKKSETVSNSNGKILLCFRNDLEKVASTKGIEYILEKNGYSFDFTDTIIHRSITENERDKYVYDKIEEFSHYDLVICDRLHAMIFSAIAGTPCIAIENVSKKISGVYHWISNLEYIKCVEVDKIDITLINEMRNKGHHNYDSNLLEQEFSSIFNK